MKKFWENSPEWQRREELRAAWRAAEEVKDAAAQLILSSVLLGATRGEIWHERVEAFKDAVNAASDALFASVDADEAFRVSPAGQAFYRRLKDPLAPAALVEQEAA
jgi:hypothetical protein